MIESCNNCRFFQTDEANTNWGNCRIVHPQLTAADGGFVFPYVKFNNWCGEWKDSAGFVKVAKEKPVTQDINNWGHVIPGGFLPGCSCSFCSRLAGK